MKTPLVSLFLVAWLGSNGLSTGNAQSAPVAAPRPPAPGPVQPAPANAPAAPASSPFEEWSQRVKHPVDWLTWGMDLRARDEYYNQIVSLVDTDPLAEQNVLRFRGRIWTAITPVTNLTFNARLAAEPRYWTRPAFVNAYRGQEGMEWRYGIFDNLNIKWNQILDQPLSLSAGRQDIALGDFWNWWLVADGTPLDGSWTYFLDSARVTYDSAELKTRFDAIGIHQRALANDWLPVLNSQQAALVEQNEQGVIFYASTRALPNLRLDGYFIYKQDERELTNGDDADIYTAGGKIAGPVGSRWSYSLEGAYQFGSKNDPMVRQPVVAAGRRSIDAFGANARITHHFNDRLNNQAHLVYEYLSGDDPDSEGRDEMFDVLWGRWPRWSELYIYSYVYETGGKIAQINNIQRIGAGWTLSPWRNGHTGVYYNALFAPQETPTRAVRPQAFSDDGHFRGHFLQAVVTHSFTRQLKGHLWSEFIWQGDYYAQRNLLTFLRAEVSWTF
jgi:hypothetical protein